MKLHIKPFIPVFLIASTSFQNVQNHKSDEVIIYVESTDPTNSPINTWTIDETSAIKNATGTTTSTNTTICNAHATTYPISKLTNNNFAISSRGFDSVVLNLGNHAANVKVLVVHLCPLSLDEPFDTYSGLAKFQGGESELSYNGTTDLNTLSPTKSYKYSYTGSKDSAMIMFCNLPKKIILELKIKKKKRDTQVDVYLDDANKDN